MQPQIKNNIISPKQMNLMRTKQQLVQGTTMVFNTNIPYLTKDYPIKIIYVPDIHMLIKEPGNRNGILISRTDQLIDELCCIMVENSITGVIFGGDIADAGSLTSELNNESHRIAKIIKIVHCADDNGFSVFGNHENTYSRNNMFYTIASLDSDAIIEDTLGLSKPDLIYPHLRTPSKIDYGIACIYLMHFRKHPEKKLYRVTDMHPNTVSLYHDDLVSFESKMKLYHHKLGKGINVHSTDIFDNVDWAILAHIHTPLETFNLGNVRRTTVDCPGSFIGRTVAENHEYIKLPVICIDESGLHKEYLKFNIGKFEETVNKELVVEQQAKRAMTALLKKENFDTDNIFDYGDLLDKIPNIEIRSIIEKASQPITPVSTKMYGDWYTKRFNKEQTLQEDEVEELEESQNEII